MKQEEKITTATVGEIFSWKEYTGEQRESIVGAPCKNKNNGRWACMNHNKKFDNQLQKDSHIHTGKHRLVWMCNEHGAEQP